jgi:hypothetical protein
MKSKKEQKRGDPRPTAVDSTKWRRRFRPGRRHSKWRPGVACDVTSVLFGEFLFINVFEFNSVISFTEDPMTRHTSSGISLKFNSFEFKFQLRHVTVGSHQIVEENIAAGDNK